MNEDWNDRPAAHRQPQERDALPVARMLLFTAGTVVVIALCVLAAWAFSLAGPKGRKAADVRPAGHDERVGRVYQVPIPAPSADRGRAEARERLDTFGWVDRRARIVHVPIERAIEWAAREEAP